MLTTAVCVVLNVSRLVNQIKPGSVVKTHSMKAMFACMVSFTRDVRKVIVFRKIFPSSWAHAVQLG